jgi:hypothetical protein
MREISSISLHYATRVAPGPHTTRADSHNPSSSSLLPSSLSQSLSPAALTHHQLHSKLHQYAVLTSLWSEEGGRSTSGTMGIPLGLVLLLPLLLLNVAGAPHEEAPAAN